MFRIPKRALEGSNPSPNADVPHAGLGPPQRDAG